jgi:hypothetical protein
MACPSCLSDNQAEFTAEMIIHYSGLKNLDNPGVLDCGVSLFVIPETKRGLLTSGTRTAESFAQGESLHDIARSREITPHQNSEIAVCTCY